MNKSEENGASIIPVFRRRLFFLLLFGIGHVIFLWAGDILLFYALFGFLLLLFFGKHGPGGKLLEQFDITVIFSWSGTAIAATVVAKLL